MMSESRYKEYKEALIAAIAENTEARIAYKMISVSQDGKAQTYFMDDIPCQLESATPDDFVTSEIYTSTFIKGRSREGWREVTVGRYLISRGDKLCLRRDQVVRIYPLNIQVVPKDLDLSFIDKIFWGDAPKHSYNLFYKAWSKDQEAAEALNREYGTTDMSYEVYIDRLTTIADSLEEVKE